MVVEVKSLARALDVLRAVTDSDAPLSATMVADQLGRDRVQIARSLHSLDSAGFLERDGDRRYAPSPRVFGVSAQIAAARLRTFGTEALRQTVEATGRALSSRRSAGIARSRSWSGWSLGCPGWAVHFRCIAMMPVRRCCGIASAAKWS